MAYYCPMRVAIPVVVLLVLLTGQIGAQSLEEETRRPRGTNSLTDDSDQLRDAGPDQPTTDSQDDDSMDLRGNTADQAPTNSLDNGSLDGGDQPDPDGQ
jgi:hypothetical protein